MEPEETCSAISGFFVALSLAIADLDKKEDRQFLLDRLAHYVKRVTGEQTQTNPQTLTSIDAENVLRLHQLLLEAVRRMDGQDS